jgi:tRNA (guanine9-N1)-methyltransferase
LTWKGEKLEDIHFFKPVVAIDLCFSEEMREKEVVSVANQVQQCYGRNRKSDRPVELHLVGHGQPAIAKVFQRHDGFENWKMFRHYEDDLTELFAAENIVYLSPESPNLVEDIDPSKVYVIGGIR